MTLDVAGSSGHDAGMDDELGTALALMHRARASLTTLECTLWTWTHHDRFRRAIEAVRDREGGSRGMLIIGYSDGDDPSPTTETEHRIWFSAPDHCREEGEHATVVQRDGERWSVPADTSRPVAHEVHHEEDPLESLRQLVDPRGVSHMTDLTAAGRGQVGGRAVLQLTATVRDLPQSPMFWAIEHQVRGADELRLSVDAETGLLVRAERRFEGEPFQVQELRGLRTGHRISAARFDPAPDLAGREVVTAEEAHARLRARFPSRSPRGTALSSGDPATTTPAVTGPPPADPASAQAAIQGALDAMFGPHERDVPGVEGGEGLGPVMAAAQERHAQIVTGARLRLDDVRFLHARLAEISYTLVTAGSAGGFGQRGFALEVDGEWLISRETLASLLGMGGVKLPPRTVGLDPPDLPAP